MIMLRLTEDECKTILSCFEVAESLYGDKGGKLKGVRRKIKDAAPGITGSQVVSNILNDMVRGRKKT